MINSVKAMLFVDSPTIAIVGTFFSILGNMRCKHLLPGGGGSLAAAAKVATSLSAPAIIERSFGLVLIGCKIVCPCGVLNLIKKIFGDVRHSDNAVLVMPSDNLRP